MGDAEIAEGLQKMYSLCEEQYRHLLPYTREENEYVQGALDIRKVGQ